jgi:hypothetical protein
MQGSAGRVRAQTQASTPPGRAAAGRRGWQSARRPAAGRMPGNQATRARLFRGIVYDRIGYDMLCVECNPQGAAGREPCRQRRSQPACSGAPLPARVHSHVGQARSPGLPAGHLSLGAAARPALVARRTERFIAETKTLHWNGMHERREGLLVACAHKRRPAARRALPSAC